MKIKLGQILGESIAKQRRQIGMTQEALAAKVELSPRSIQRIEAGDEKPRYEALFNIADTLSTEPQAFIAEAWAYWQKEKNV